MSDRSHRPDRPVPGTPHDGNASGGWGSLKGMARILGGTPPEPAVLRTLARLNKPGGVQCTSCGWAKPRDPHAVEFCENGAKAHIWEMDSRRADRDFFAENTVAQLKTLHDHDLEKSGRLTEPMRYDAKSDRYLPVSWDAALAEIGVELAAMDPTGAEFYASGHAGLEASFLYALFARAMGHQNLPQSSNMCHETTSVNLQTFLGTPVGTCTLEDFDHADAIFFFGQNTGTNSPRFLHTLKAAVERGCRIVTFNPVRERGLVEFVDPRSVGQMTVGRPTRISEKYYQVRPGGDVAVLLGLVKCVLDAEDAAPGTVVDHAFVRAETTGYDGMIEAVRAFDWADIVAQSGLTRQMIQDAADIYLCADRAIGIYGMGLTQHVNGWLNIGMLCNLLLMRGNVGRPGTGCSPVGGH